MLAEDLVVEALYAERELVALVLRGLDRVGGIRRVLDSDGSGAVVGESDAASTGGGLVAVRLLPATIDDDGDTPRRLPAERSGWLS